ncbi:hypothetical protein [Stenotrophomonas sp. MMGLT7]|uniref:hypothetical protein n=1 Tax=Stenotrophomonas sp. MMGLT7 TaxID=2901227 RepID=UPI001E31D57D|nr:hypothetical protein [Stenotrophomonas sp. MMGLT7]MCD7096923.1 hypothetical protein [Stenotrophomonas sp. MMGLT7]
MHKLSLVVLLLLSGCTSYGELQSQPAKATLHSARPPAEFAGCVMPKIRELWPVVEALPDGNATVYVYPIERSTTIGATIRVAPAADGGSDIEFRDISIRKRESVEVPVLRSCL